MLVRKDLHPALQYLLLEAMRSPRAPGSFNEFGEFPAEQPNDLPLSPMAAAFYRSGATFWQRYTSFWLSSLLIRVVFFVIPVLVTLIPVVGFAPRIYRWLYVRRINRLHRTLGHVERQLASTVEKSQLVEYQELLTEIDSCCAVAQGRAPVRGRFAATS